MLGFQEGHTSGLADIALAYAATAIYKLLLRPTNSLVNLVVANQTLVDDSRGIALRTVELSIVTVSQPACFARVKSDHNEYLGLHLRSPHAST